MLRLFSRTSIADKMFIGLICGLLAATLVIVVHGKVNAGKVTCDRLVDFEFANKLFNSDRLKYKALDRDHDGIPCEGLIK